MSSNSDDCANITNIKWMQGSFPRNVAYTYILTDFSKEKGYKWGIIIIFVSFYTFRLMNSFLCTQY